MPNTSFIKANQRIDSSVRDSSTNQEAGFTLVEIAVAVAILGIALVTLVGLHTRMLDTYYNEQNKLKAAMYAQYLMTQIEVEADPPDAGSEESDLLSALEEAGYFSSEKFEEADESLRDWTVNKEVLSIGLPLASEELAEDALRQIIIAISWGEGGNQTYSLTYFINNTAPAAGGSELTPQGSN